MKHIIRAAAKRDIFRQIRYYLDQGAGDAAARFLECVTHSIKSLTKDPLIGAPKQSRAPSLSGLRSWPVKDFEDLRVYYLVKAGTLCVVRVLHGKRDLRAILNTRDAQKHS